MKKDIRKYLPWIILLLLILSLSTWYVLSRRVTDEQRLLYQSKIEQAQSYVEGMQFSVAMQKYYEAVEIIPNEVGAYEGIVSVLVTKNRLDDARDIVEQAEKSLNSWNKSILYQALGDAYFERGEYSEAQEMYDAGSFFGVNNMELELMLGKTYINLGNLRDARAQLTRSGYHEDLLGEANLLLAYIYALEDVDRAMEILSSTDSEYKGIYHEEFEGVLESLDDDEKFNAAKLARVYTNNGYPFLAIQALEPIREEIVEYLEGMYFLGRAYFDYGQYQEAIEALDGALTLGGMEQEILWLRARSYFLLNDLENSLSSYDGAVGYSEGSVPPELMKEYVGILLDNNRVLKASDLLRGVHLIESEKTYYKLLALEVNYRLQEHVRLEYYIEQLENTALNNEEEREFLQWKVYILLENGITEEDEARLERYMDRLFELGRFNPYYYLYLARIQLKQGEQELAIQSLEQALEYDLEYKVSDEVLRLLSSLR